MEDLEDLENFGMENLKDRLNVIQKEITFREEEVQNLRV